MNWREAHEDEVSHFLSGKDQASAKFYDVLQQHNIHSLVLYNGNRCCILCADPASLESAAGSPARFDDESALLVPVGELSVLETGALLDCTPVIAANPQFVGAISYGQSGKERQTEPPVAGHAVSAGWSIEFSLEPKKDALFLDIYKLDRSLVVKQAAIESMKGSPGGGKIGEGLDNLKGRSDWFSKRQGRNK